MISAEAAYRRCEEITWSQARNFAYGIRLLPPPKRRAMAALYAMARRIDDVGDGDWPQDRKLAALDELHRSIDALAAGKIADASDPVLVGLGHAADRYPIPVAALHEIVEGSELDVRGASYATMDDTLRYCRLVAGSVGRLSLGVFGVQPHPRPPPRWPGSVGRLSLGVFGTKPVGAVAAGPTGSRAGPAEAAQSPGELADDLGVALQLTNMLRDIVEDHRMGRIYLPEQDRDRFGIDPGQWSPPENAAALVQFVAGQAVMWFEHGLVLLDHLDHRSRACTAAMAGIYRRLLSRILARPEAPLQGRVSLPAHQKALVAARSLSGLRP